MNGIYQYRQYILVLLSCLVFAAPSQAFSILAHEAIIDAGWATHIRPLLQKKYPQATEAQLDAAHAYAYGGCLVADMGYMPFGSPYFTNLLHYVRSGDFVNTLVEESQNVNEYAFALGAISHYMADKYGHALATNLSVPIFYPGLKKKFGNVITYDDDHTSHSAMEFAFDVIQMVKGNYASTAYQNFVGFYMATPVLKRAFLKTYGQSLDKVFPNFESATNTFRWGVRNLFPALEQIAWKSDRQGILKSRDSIGRANFFYKIPKQAFEQKFGKQYARIGLTARSIAFVIEAMPDVGPFKKMHFHYPGVACERLFTQSMDSIIVNYEIVLNKLGKNMPALPNINYDTGQSTTCHEYALADEAYKDWLMKLKADKTACITTAIQSNIIAFYQKIDHKKLRDELKVLAVLTY